eukprot:TRINITY_DN9430_c0_g2_i1.p1 TRINITY_DN9430_c0_g2~~TRINITY_DN9430_c0_g2_i1.p1  ORF type:complete len:425 (-),score=54.67 TRINITY_DN9430_c0_g2_i1:466-1740(-)
MSSQGSPVALPCSLSDNRSCLFPIDQSPGSCGNQYVEPLLKGSSPRGTELPNEFPCSLGGKAPRLVDRTAVFRQSKGRLRIRRVNDSGSTWRLRWSDAYHSILSMRAWKLASFTAVTVILSWLTFATFFMLVSKRCNLEADTFLRALYLSIETMETVGYGVPDEYYNNCYSGLCLLGFATVWASLLSAAIFSIVYTRLSRADSRATTVCFSNKAIIRQLGDNCYFMFQVMDFRKHQLIEAHVRLYAIQHTETANGTVFQTRAMRLQHPDDELGGMLLLVLPQLVVHRIDAWSPLCPPSQRAHPGCSAASSFNFPDIPQRSADAENGNRDGGPEALQPGRPSMAAITSHMLDVNIEIVCLVEGIEPVSSGTTQARFSYTNEDIVCNADFQRCVTHGAGDVCEVNIAAFNEVVAQEGNNMLVQSMT